MASTSSSKLQQKMYKPQHPLPDELREMEQDETVCQFCGVSYLIHNEVKKLEEEIEKYKEKLKYYEGHDEREAELNARLEEKAENLKTASEHLRNETARSFKLKEQLTESDKMLKASKNENISLKNELTAKDNELDKSIRINKKFHTSLKSLLLEVSGIKKDTDLLRKSCNEVNGFIVHQLLNAKQGMDRLTERFEDETKRLIQQNNDKLKLTEGELKILRDDLFRVEDENRQNREVGKRLEVTQKTLDENKNEIKKVLAEKDALTEALNKMKALLSERGRKVDSLETDLQEKDRSEKETRTSYEKAITKYKFENEALSKECQQYQHQIEAIKQMNKDEKDAISTTSIQLKVLKESLDMSKKEISVLKKERQDMVDAHQNRIQQLIDSFNEKISEANAWPKVLEEKLTEQQLRFNEERSDLWKQLTTSFEKEIKDLNEKHDKEKKEIENKENDSKTKLREQLETLQRRSREEIENHKSSFAKEKDKNTKIIQSQESLIDNLDHKVRHLESRLANSQKKSSDDTDTYKKKYMEVRDFAESMKVEMKKIGNDLKDKQKEVELLQDTVRRECEERFELTEALSEARLQLLGHNSTSKTSLRKSSVTDKDLLPSPPPPISSTERGRRDFKRKLKLTESYTDTNNDTMNMRGSVAMSDKAITFDKVKESLDETYNRKRIADAVAKQRANSRTNFNNIL
eukprot:gene15134-16690_t